MYYRKLDEIATETTLPTERKLFYRQPKSGSSSRESSRRSFKDKPLQAQISIPYIKLDINTKQYSSVLNLNLNSQKPLSAGKESILNRTAPKKVSNNAGSKEK
jgi:hypothetical protein